MVAAVVKVAEGNQCPRIFAHASGDAAPKLRPLQEAKAVNGDWRVVNRVNRCWPLRQRPRGEPMLDEAQAPRSVAAKDVHASQHWQLTFDMSGRRKHAEGAFDCPLDGRVGPRLGEQRLAPRWKAYQRARRGPHGRRLNQPGRWCCATAQDEEARCETDGAGFFGVETGRTARADLTASLCNRAFGKRLRKPEFGGEYGHATNGRSACMVKAESGPEQANKPEAHAGTCIWRESASSATRDGRSLMTRCYAGPNV